MESIGTTNTYRLEPHNREPVSRRLLILAGLLLFATLGLLSCTKEPSGSEPLIVGWQPPWANQGQLVAILKHTDLLDKAGVKVNFVPFTYGAPMIEGALARRVDVVLAGEQPVLTLLSKSQDWRIVARLTRYRSAIVIPTSSPLTTLRDLRGKTVATAFGSTTHRDLVAILAKEGIETEVRLVNLDQAEHAGVIAGGGKTSWGPFDAIATYDPTIARATATNAARILHAWASPALVAVRNDVIQVRRADIKGFLDAYVQSYVRYAQNPTEANQWYSEESRLQLTDSDYADIAKYEPNMQAGTTADVEVELTDQLLAETTRNMATALRVGILKTSIDLSAYAVRDLLPTKK